MESSTILLIVFGILALWVGWRIVTFKIRRKK